MAQIIPQDTIAERLGTGLGSGFSQGLNTILNHKITQMTKDTEREKSYSNLVNSGYDPSVARFVSGFDPKEQVKLLSNLWQRGYNPGSSSTDNQQQQAQPETIQNTMQELGQGPAQPSMQEVLAPQQNTPQNMAQVFGQQAGLGGTPVAPLNAALSGAANELRKGLKKEVVPNQPNQPQQVQNKTTPNTAVIPKPKNAAQILSQPPPPSPDTQARLNQQQEQFDRKFKHDLNKEASKFLDPYSDKAEGSRNNIRDYDLIISAANKGDLRSGNTQVLLDKFGLGDFNKNLTTQIVEKSLARLGQNAGAAFGQGTRLTNYLEQTYQRSLPRLWNTKEGIVKISEINKLMEQANLLKEQEAVNLLKENNGEKPFNSKQLVNERVQPQLDQLAQKAIDLLQPTQFAIKEVLDKLPDPSKYKGLRARNTDTGEMMISNGTQWIPEINKEKKMPIEILETKPNDSESIAQYAARTTGRTLARAGESVLGLPGDIAQAGLGLGSYLTNNTIPNYQQVQEKLPEGLSLPTSEQLRDITKEHTGQYLEPQGKGEKFYDDIIGDAATLFVPVKGAKPLAKATARALGISSAANVADWAGKEISGPGLGAGAKIGTILFANALGTRANVRKLQKDTYDKAYSKLPENKPFNLAPENEKMEALKKYIQKGDREDKKYLLERINAYEDIVSKPVASEVKETGLLGPKGEKLTKVIPGKEGGNIDQVKDLVNLKQDWNKYISSSTSPKETRDLISRMVNIANQGINRAEKLYPEFSKYYRVGEEITKGLNTKNLVQTFLDKYPTLQKNASNPLVNKVFYGLGSAGLTYGATNLNPATLGAVALGTSVALGAREAFKAMQLFSKSPAARNSYYRAIKYAAADNVKGFRKELIHLSKEADKYTNKGSGEWEIEA